MAKPEFQQVLDSVAYGDIPHNDARIRCARAVYDKVVTNENPLWQELRELFGLDGWHDGHFNGIPNPEQIVTHCRYVARERSRLLLSTMTSSVMGWKLAMRVLQSDLYQQLDEAERAECDAMIKANPHLKVDNG